MSAKERNLVKGAIRRVFSRSDLRRSVIESSVIKFLDPNRPRVKKWSLCPICKTNIPTYLMEVDHINPIVPLDKTLEDLSWDFLIDSIWCDKMNLKAICKDCHKVKTAAERKARRKINVRKIFKRYKKAITKRGSRKPRKHSK